jgi:4-methyl-5(b-hydroxyethyl)-thiazole monophosphate biosynthesis
MLQYFAKEESKYVAAICAAPTVLRQANVFMGKNLTSYPVFEKDLSQGKNDV